MFRKLASRLTGALARIPLPRALRGAVYGSYARRYGVAIEEVELVLDAYPTMDAFFTRRLKAGLRVADPDPRALVSPVDGSISACGSISGGSLIQAKGIAYSLEDLLGGDRRYREFEDGLFLTLYLAPGDCHRVYAPFDLRVLDERRIGGTLRPVRHSSVERIPRLFCRNERLILHLDSPVGPAAFVFVGAMNVGSIERIAAIGGPTRKGEELGTFHLGSTVILLLPRGAARWDELAAGERVRIGRRIGLFRAL